jgi:hypothetical protein
MSSNCYSKSCHAEEQKEIMTHDKIFIEAEVYGIYKICVEYGIAPIAEVKNRSQNSIQKLLDKGPDHAICSKLHS